MTKDRKTTRQGPPKYGPADSKVTPRFSGVRTYARLPHVVDMDEDVDVAIIGVPFDTGGTYRVGARFGPEHIRSASALMRPYHYAGHVSVFEELSVVDYGDLPVLPGYIEESQRRILKTLLEVLHAGVIPIDLGGGPFDRAAGAAERSPRSTGRLRGSPILTATPIRPTSTCLTRTALDVSRSQGRLIDTSHSIRSACAAPSIQNVNMRFLARWGWIVVTAIDARVGDGCRRRSDCGAESVTSKVFFSFDIDFIDPACARRRGLPRSVVSPREAQSILRRLGGIDYVGFDVVEVIPEYDVAESTSFVAANVVYEFLALLARNRRDGRTKA